MSEKRSLLDDALKEKIAKRSLRFPWRILRVFYFAGQRFCKNNHIQWAVALTYNTLFAIVPLAALSFGLAKGFGLDQKFEEALLSKFPAQSEVFVWIQNFADKTLAQAKGGVVAGVGIVLLVFTVLSLATHIEKAFNSIWGLASRKNLLRRFSSSLTIMLLAPILLAVLSSSGVLIRSYCGRLLSKLPFLATVGMDVAGYVLDLFPILLVCVVFMLIYLWVPNTKVKFGAAVFGGLVAGVLFQILQDVFILMQGTIFRYNKVYGSFSVLPLFLIWLQWSWQIALFGAELTFVEQNLTSGLFDKLREEKLSNRLRRMYQLSILSFVFRRFEAGQGAVAENEVVDYVKITPLMVQILMNELVENGLLAFADGENEESRYYLPALSPEEFRICDAVKRLNSAGVDIPLPESAEAVRRIAVQLESIDNASFNAAGNVLVKEI